MTNRFRAAALAGVLCVSQGFGLSARAEAICFKDVRSYDEVVNRLPPRLRHGELYGVSETPILTGAFKISQVGSRFNLEVHGRLLGHTLNDNTFIREICSEGSNVTVTIDSGYYDVIALTPQGFYLRGFNFRATNRLGYDQVALRFSN